MPSTLNPKVPISGLGFGGTGGAGGWASATGVGAGGDSWLTVAQAETRTAAEAAASRRRLIRKNTPRARSLPRMILPASYTDPGIWRAPPPGARAAVAAKESAERSSGRSAAHRRVRECQLLTRTPLVGDVVHDQRSSHARDRPRLEPVPAAIRRQKDQRSIPFERAPLRPGRGVPIEIRAEVGLPGLGQLQE